MHFGPEEGQSWSSGRYRLGRPRNCAVSQEAIARVFSDARKEMGLIKAFSQVRTAWGWARSAPGPEEHNPIRIANLPQDHFLHPLSSRALKPPIAAKTNVDGCGTTKVIAGMLTRSGDGSVGLALGFTKTGFWATGAPAPRAAHKI